MFLPVLSAINQAGGGVPLIPSSKSTAAVGTMVAPNQLSDVPLLTPASLTEALTQAQFVVGVTEIVQGIERVQVLESVATDR